MAKIIEYLRVLYFETHCVSIERMIKFNLFVDLWLLR